MPCNINRSKWCRRAIAISHSRPVPKGITITYIIMDITKQFKSGIINTVKSKIIKVKIISHFGSPMCIGSSFIYLSINIIPIIIGIGKIGSRTIISTGIHIISFNSVTTTNFAKPVTSTITIGSNCLITAIFSNSSTSNISIIKFLSNI